MWRQFLAAAACLVATAQAVVISDQVSVTGDGNFNFEVLGSLCIPESVTATVTVQTQGVVSGVTPSGLMLVFNQTSLHSLFSDGSTCGQQSVRVCFRVWSNRVDVWTAVSLHWCA